MCSVNTAAHTQQKTSGVSKVSNKLYGRTDTTFSGERSRGLVRGVVGAYTTGDRGERPVDRYVTPATTTAATTHTHHHEGACHDSRPRCSSRRIRIMLVIVLLQWYRFGVHGGVRRRSGMLACVSIYCCDLIIVLAVLIR